MRTQSIVLECPGYVDDINGPGVDVSHAVIAFRSSHCPEYMRERSLLKQRTEDGS